MRQEYIRAQMHEEMHANASRTRVMGILNVTPDSFSDGGRYGTVEAAVARAEQMVAEGADLVDIGGESTRPGHVPISVDEELRRVMPVVERVVESIDLPISIDTTKPEVARRALAAGARIVNDQWGLQGDPSMAEAVAEAGATVIAMHNQHGHTYRDLLADIIAYLERSLEVAAEVGIARERVIVDPGFGFGKTPAQNLEVLRRLGELRVLQQPILVGTSRKSMIARVLGDAAPEDRMEGTAATVALAIAFGADMVRVHDVRAMVRVARMTDAVVRAKLHGERAPADLTTAPTELRT
jgi:dihydropteroate synthase